MDIKRIIQLTENQIRERQLAFRREFDADYNVAGAILYGSRVKGTNRRNSDLDVYPLTRDETSTDVDDFSFRLELLLRKNRLPIDVDVFGHGPYTDNSLGEKLFGHSDVFKGKYVIVSPFFDVKQVVEDNIKKYKSVRKNKRVV